MRFAHFMRPIARGFGPATSALAMSAKRLRKFSFYTFSIICLGPTLYLFLLGAFLAHHQFVYYSKLPIHIVLAAISLFGALWTVFRFEQLTLRKIPYYIWVSYLIGLSLGIYLSYPLVSQAGFHPGVESFLLLWSLGTGPIILLLTALLILWKRN